MGYYEAQPSASLKPYVQCYWMMHFSHAVETSDSHQVLPDGCMDILFDLQNNNVEIVGTMTRGIEVSPNETVDLFGVRFKPAGIYPFIQTSASELTDLSVDASTFLGDWVHQALEELRSSESLLKRATALNATLERCLTQCQSDDNLFLKFLSKISTSDISKVEDMLPMVGLSQRTLERYFQKQVGVSAKKFLSVLRFRRVLREVASRRTRPDWSDMAIRHGYYDQAHFIHEFKGFTGKTPAQFLLNDPTLSDFYNTSPDLHR